MPAKRLVRFGGQVPGRHVSEHPSSSHDGSGVVPISAARQCSQQAAGVWQGLHLKHAILVSSKYLVGRAWRLCNLASCVHGDAQSAKQ